MIASSTIRSLVAQRGRRRHAFARSAAPELHNLDLLATGPLSGDRGAAATGAALRALLGVRDASRSGNFFERSRRDFGSLPQLLLSRLRRRSSLIKRDPRLVLGWVSRRERAILCHHRRGKQGLESIHYFSDPPEIGRREQNLQIDRPWRRLCVAA